MVWHGSRSSTRTTCSRPSRSAASTSCASGSPTCSAMLKSFAVTDSELEGAFEEGMGFDGSSIDGFTRIEESDMVAFPNAETFQVLPWRPDEQGVGRMFCDITKPDGSPFEGDPRYALKPHAEEGRGHGLHHVRRSRARVLLLRRRPGHRDPRPGRLLRPHAARRRVATCAARPCSRSRRWASRSSTRTTRSPRRSTRSTCATPDALTHGRRRHDVPPRRQGDRDGQRRVRHVHAEADLRPERLGHAHPPVAVQQGRQRVLRRQRSRGLQPRASSRSTTSPVC